MLFIMQQVPKIVSKDEFLIEYINIIIFSFENSNYSHFLNVMSINKNFKVICAILTRVS